ncbi:MAG: HlyC/CorC family transporter [Thiotrichaceae bacterium]
MSEPTLIVVLFLVLLLLFILSAFFSGSETALMSLDRYKLRHMARRNKNANLALKLLEQPDRLIGVILLGNNLVNILITQLATYLGYILGSNAGVAIATGVLALMLLIFAELTPKTLAAVKSEKIAYPAARIYTPLLKVVAPVVWLANFIANSLLRKFGVDPEDIEQHSLNREEFRSLVRESDSLIPNNHQEMLLSILDLESTTVEDIMIPRMDISGVDLTNDWEEVEKQLANSPFSRLLVYKDSPEETLGFLHLRKLIPYLRENKLDQQHLEQTLRPAYYTLETTVLAQQLINFRAEKQRIALVVDEYGDIQGLVTLTDILEEIVGQFATDPASITNEIIYKKDGTLWVDGGMNIREINRLAKLELPTNKEAKTLNGLVIEHMETMPVEGLSMLIDRYPLEVHKVENNTVKTLIIHPRLKQNTADNPSIEDSN